MKKTIKPFVTIRTLFNITESIKNLLNFMKNTRIYTRK